MAEDLVKNGPLERSVYTLWRGVYENIRSLPVELNIYDTVKSSPYHWSAIVWQMICNHQPDLPVVCLRKWYPFTKSWKWSALHVGVLSCSVLICNFNDISLTHPHTPLLAQCQHNHTYYLRQLPDLCTVVKWGGDICPGEVWLGDDLWREGPTSIGPLFVIQRFGCLELYTIVVSTIYSRLFTSKIVDERRCISQSSIQNVTASQFHL